MLLLTFIGCYGLTSLPGVAFVAYKSGLAFNSTIFGIALLEALPPAIANSAFVKLSNIRWKGTTMRNALFDFVVFAALGGGTGIVAAALVSLWYLHGAEDFSGFMTFFQYEIPFMCTVTLVSGLNGALQCGASRVIKAHPRPVKRTRVPSI